MTGLKPLGARPPVPLPRQTPGGPDGGGAREARMRPKIFRNDSSTDSKINEPDTRSPGKQRCFPDKTPRTPSRHLGRNSCKSKVPADSSGQLMSVPRRTTPSLTASVPGSTSARESDTVSQTERRRKTCQRLWRAVIYGNVPASVWGRVVEERTSNSRARAHVGAVQFTSGAEVSVQVEGLFSAAAHMEMRNNEVNTVNFTSLSVVIAIKGTRVN